jgi:hypothetical protein
MKILGNGKVWSPSHQRSVIEFVNGEFETDDKELIDIAKLNGFEVTGEVKEEVKVLRTRTKKE